MKKKPVFLWPCILVYRLLMQVIYFIRYVALGVFVSLYMIIKVCFPILWRFLRYELYGFVFVCYTVYLLLKFVFVLIPVHSAIGFTVVIFIIRSAFKQCMSIFYNGFITVFESIYNVFEKSKKKKKKKEKTPETTPKEVEPEVIKEDEITEPNIIAGEVSENGETPVTEEMKEEPVVKKKKGIGAIVAAINSLPKAFVNAIKNSYNNSSVVRYINNKKALASKELLINFDGEEAEKSESKLLFEYVAKDAEGKMVKGYFEAYSKLEVHSFLLSEGMTVYSIRNNKWITFLHKGEATTKKRMKNKDLIFFLTQLSTYLKSGITLVESLKILARQYNKNKRYQRIFNTVVYDLTMGDSFSDALEKQGAAFPKILINMVKTSEMTGELPEVLDDMAEHFSKIDKTRKEMVNAMLYPTLVFVFAIGVIIFILLFVIPRFVEIYESMDDSQIPAFTMFIMHLSEFLQSNFFILAAIIVLIIVIIYQLYKRVKAVRTGMQWFAMHLPVFGNVIIYNEVATFTKTLSSLLKHNVPLDQCMDILNKLTNNEVYKMLILDTVNNLGKGEQISLAFKGHWAFPVPAYEMLVTGERTGELPEMMEKVADYYQTLQETSVTRIKTFIEPILIVFLTTVVGAIVLAIVIPMFNMYNAVQ